MEELVLTRQEAAEYLKISVRHLDRIIKSRAFPVAKLKSSVRILKKPFLTWVESCRDQNTIRPKEGL